MKNTKRCPKCSSQNIVRVPDDAHRYLANSICITKFAVVKRIPVARYACCDCGMGNLYDIINGGFNFSRNGILPK